MTKDSMVEALGETELLLPDRLNRGLVANDRLKYYLTLLQAAHRHARETGASFSNLRDEREACGVDDESLDTVVEASRTAGDSDVYIPSGQHILELLWEELALMLRPLGAAGAFAEERRLVVAGYERRYEQLRAQASTGSHDRLSFAVMDALIGRAEAGGDNVHQLVMDLHKELIRLQASVAQEVIEGARAYGLGPGDRVWVAAFMRGVNETAPLKFDHPGLGTTATRVGTRLSIQNDIGTTGTHVVVVHVERLKVTVIYTDVHPRRLAFLRALLASFAIEWRTSPAPGGACEMAVGHFSAQDDNALVRFLSFFGSRLVFLIDWNKARKRLERFVRRSDAIAILLWAAETGVGHCAFLKVDGTRLVDRAIEAAPASKRSVRLDELLGRDNARTFLKALLGLVFAGVRAGRTARLMQDQVEAELLHHLLPGGRGLIAAAADHAMYIASLSERLRRTFVQAAASADGEAVRTSDLAKKWEEAADEIVRRWNRVRERAGAGRVFSKLLNVADAAADTLEEAAFLLTMVPIERREGALASIEELPDLVDRSAKEYVRCLDFAKRVTSIRRPSDVDAVLVAVDRLATIEHQCDLAQRAAEARLIRDAADFRELYLMARIVQMFEESADTLARCGVLVKDYVLRAGAEA